MLRTAHQWAVRNGVEVWLLPELCLDKDDLEELKSYIKAQSGRLKVVLPGTSYVRNSLGGYSNRAPIWLYNGSTWDTDNHYYDKVIPFIMNTDISSSTPDVKRISEQAVLAGKSILEEDIDCGNVFNTREISGATYGVAICRDVLDVFDKANPLLKYCDKSDLVLVTSMNSGHTNLFTASAESMARWHDCTTIYVNNSTSVPSVSNNTVEMSFALLPNPDKAAGVSGQIYYRKAPVFGQTSEIDESYEQYVNTIYSGGVTAHALPDGGNVLFRIVNGKLVVS